MIEFEQWLFEFKRVYRADRGTPSLPYETLRYLLDAWHAGFTPSEGVALAKEHLRKEAERGRHA